MYRACVEMFRVLVSTLSGPQLGACLQQPPVRRMVWPVNGITDPLSIVQERIGLVIGVQIDKQRSKMFRDRGSRRVVRAIACLRLCKGLPQVRLGICEPPLVLAQDAEGARHPNVCWMTATQ